MRIADILRNKGNSIVTIDAHTTVNGLLCDLARHNIGAMVVVDDDAMSFDACTSVARTFSGSRFPRS